MYKKTNIFKQCLTAKRPTSHNKNSKNQKGAIIFAARRHNVNVLLLLCDLGRVAVKHCFKLLVFYIYICCFITICWQY